MGFLKAQTRWLLRSSAPPRAPHSADGVPTRHQAGAAGAEGAEAGRKLRWAELSALQTGLMMSEQDQIEEFEQQIDVVKEMIRQDKEKLRKRRRMSPY